MKKIILLENEKNRIEKLARTHPVARVRERAKMIELLNKGKKPTEIAEIMNRSIKTVYKYINKYIEHGEEGLFDKEHTSHNVKITDKMRDFIEELTFKEENCTANSIVEALKEQFDITVHESTVRYNLKKRPCL